MSCSNNFQIICASSGLSRRSLVQGLRRITSSRGLLSTASAWSLDNMVAMPLSSIGQARSPLSRRIHPSVSTASSSQPPRFLLARWQRSVSVAGTIFPSSEVQSVPGCQGRWVFLGFLGFLLASAGGDSFSKTTSSSKGGEVLSDSEAYWDSLSSLSSLRSETRAELYTGAATVSWLSPLALSTVSMLSPLPMPKLSPL